MVTTGVIDEEKEMPTVTHHYVSIVDYVNRYVTLIVMPLRYVKDFSQIMQTE